MVPDESTKPSSDKTDDTNEGASRPIGDNRKSKLKQVLKKVALGLLPLTAGFGVVLSSALNGEVAELLGHSLWGTVMNKVTSTALAILPGFLWPGPPFIDSLKESFKACKVDWYVGFIYISAIFSSWYALCSVSFPRLIGYGLFFLAVVLGQVILSVIIDLTGFLWGALHIFNAIAWIGISLVVVGALVFQIQAIIANASFDWMTFLLVLLAITAGSSRVCNAGLNKKLNSYIKCTPRVMLWVFGSSTVIVLIPALIVEPHPTFSEVEWSDWWKFCGCFFSIYSMAVNTNIPKYIGFASTYAWTILGQLFGSLLFDAIGFLGSEVIPVSASRLVGVGVVMVGVIALQLGKKLKSPAVAKDEIKHSEADTGTTNADLSTSEDENYCCCIGDDISSSISQEHDDDEDDDDTTASSSESITSSQLSV